MTITILILTTIFLILYDIYAVVKGGLTNTISWKVYTLSKTYPILPFSIGVLMGHFFWSQC